MARNAETNQAADNPAPIVRKMTRVGASAADTGIGGTGDTFFIAYHGYAHTHMDTLCHFLYDGKMYNGYSQDEVTEEGAGQEQHHQFQERHHHPRRADGYGALQGRGLAGAGHADLSGRSGSLGEEGGREGAGAAM